MSAAATPEATPATARLSVEHETLYRYDHPVEQSQHVACLRPLSDAGQRLLSFEMAEASWNDFLSAPDDARIG